MEKIFEFLLHIVVKIISDFGYTGIMVASALESACIPLPSEIIFPFSGYLVFATVSHTPINGGVYVNFTFFYVMLFGMIGQLLGSIAAYYAGYFGALPLLKKYGKYILIKEHELEIAQKWFEKYGDGAVFWGRILPVIRTFISLPAGVAKMNFGKFVFYTTIGCIPWLWALTYAGFYLGKNWPQVRTFFHKYEFVILGFLIIAIIVYIFLHKNAKARKNNS